MGDRTPTINTVGKVTSKYLTPCRTFGLKRRSTPSSELGKKNKSENDLLSLTEKSVEDSPVTRSNPLSRTCLSPFNLLNCQTECQLTPVKPYSKSLNLQQRPLKTPKKVVITSFSQTEKNNPLDAQVSEKISKINEKFKRIEKLKQEEIYTRKHNLLELQKSTDKWLRAFKEIAIALHSELQERGRNCTILDILEEHNISPERVGFNKESQEFD